MVLASLEKMPLVPYRLEVKLRYTYHRLEVERLAEGQLVPVRQVQPPL